MSKPHELLTARNAILASAAVFVLSLLGMCISMLRPQDSGGLGRDSHGTRGGGYRALVEILEEIGVGVSRSIAPPQPDAADRHTLVIIDPNSGLVEISPKYVQALRGWVEQGGRVVVTPSTSHSLMMFGPEMPGSDDAPRDILDALDVNEKVSAGPNSEEDEGDDESNRADRARRRQPWLDSDDELFSDDDWPLWSRPAGEPRIVDIRLEGSLAPLAQYVSELAVPGDGFLTLSGKPEELDGALTCADTEGEQHLVVAAIKRGKGEVIVVAEPALLSNFLIARADNSVMAVNLIAPRGEDVVFDEFYHGLAVRGNPLYLLTRPGFAAVTLGLLAVVGVWTWRSAIFLGPPLADKAAPRRDIREYVSAMGEFFSRGQGSRRFVVREVRDGVLRQICHELRLPMDTLDLETITSALARRDRARAEQLASAVREVDEVLAAPGEYPRSTFLPVMQRLANCL